MQALSLEQIAQWAPDAASFKAAQGLKSHLWLHCGQHQHYLWGDYQGSGKKPYQIAINLSGQAAFKCSCPSRKFPCKHSLALLLHWHKKAESFAAAEALPDWMEEWISRREKRQQAAPQKVNAEGRKKRLENRFHLAEEGLKDLQLWLHDVLRQGLHHFGRQKAWPESMAKRMVDAQMPRLAENLLALADCDTPAQLLRELSLLHLTAELFARREALPSAWQREMEAQLGFPISKESILEKEGLRQPWLYMGCWQRKLALKGYETQHWYCSLNGQNFAHIDDFHLQPQYSRPIHQHGEGELCFYEGIESQKALIKNWQPLKVDFSLQESALTVEDAQNDLRRRLKNNPFLKYTAFRVDRVALMQKNNQWALSDGRLLLPLDLSEMELKKLMALSGGRTLTAFLLYDVCHQKLRLLSYLSAGNGFIYVDE